MIHAFSSASRQPEKASGPVREYDWKMPFEMDSAIGQGKLISACPIIGGPLISSSEQSYDSPRSRPSTFTEENHGYLAAADSQVPTPPQRPTNQPLQTALTHRHRHDGHLCRHRQSPTLEQ